MKTNDPDVSITVILPCAGEGRRLGLSSPKELLAIDGDNPHPVRLIDYSLQHIRAFEKHEAMTVAVVTRPWKAEVAEYVKDQLPDIRVETVMFDDKYMEWPGSVYSAAKMFSFHNVVLLPDSYLSLSNQNMLNHVTTKDKDGNSLLYSMSEALKRSPVVFGAVSCNDIDRLRHLGAMRVEKDLVTKFQDKPNTDVQSFNAFWGCYGFRQEQATNLYEFLIASVHHCSGEIVEQGFAPVGTVPIAQYFDLGTWERIEAFKRISGQKN